MNEKIKRNLENMLYNFNRYGTRTDFAFIMLKSKYQNRTVIEARDFLKRLYTCLNEPFTITEVCWEVTAVFNRNGWVLR